MVRAVLDTNILVSALLTPRGEAAAIVRRMSDFALCTSEEILTELQDVFGRDRIRRRYPLSDEDVIAYVARLRASALIVIPRISLSGISRDPDDDKFFACAIAARADCIVSRDPHILDVQDFAASVLTPRHFLEWLRLKE